MKRMCVLLFILLLESVDAYAHQPRIAFGSRHPREAPIIVDQPEISKAYYGELNGEADHYRIESAKPFVLYMNLLTPEEAGARTDICVDVSAGGRKILTIGGSAAAWKSYYEKFANDHYFRSQEFMETVDAGTYEITVYNKDNRGRYCLAVGNIESFPLDETIKTAFTLPVIKKEFFSKPAISAFLNLVGLFLAIELVIALAVVGGIILLVRTLAKRRR